MLKRGRPKGRKGEYLTIKQICFILHAHPNTIYGWVHKGLKTRRGGGKKLLIHISNLRRFLEEVHPEALEALDKYIREN
jgi:hypothetical protein